MEGEGKHLARSGLIAAPVELVPCRDLDVGWSLLPKEHEPRPVMPATDVNRRGEGAGFVSRLAHAAGLIARGPLLPCEAPVLGLTSSVENDPGRRFGERCRGAERRGTHAAERRYQHKQRSKAHSLETTAGGDMRHGRRTVIGSAAALPTPSSAFSRKAEVSRNASPGQCGRV